MAASSHAESISPGESINQQILNASRDEFRKLQPSATGQPYDKVVVGAAALRYAPGAAFPKLPSILLLKRAAHEVYFPNVFELPSGKVDPEDPTIKHALVREVQEETGLNVIDIVAELKPMIYTTDKMVVDNTGRDVLVSKSAIQLNYVILISDGDVKLSADEHSESTWAIEEELNGLNITSAMRVVVQEALEWAASVLLGGGRIREQD
jgi:8-oxo-dGTP pyrophosphatase MutT (NUDIX family)